jgi:hypothetical protein
MSSYKKEKDLRIHRFEGKVTAVSTDSKSNRYLIKEMRAGEYLGFVYPDYALAEFINEHVSVLMVIRKKFTGDTIIKKIAKKLLPKQDKE